MWLSSNQRLSPRALEGTLQPLNPPKREFPKPPLTPSEAPPEASQQNVAADAQQEPAVQENRDGPALGRSRERALFSLSGSEGL